MIKIEKIQIKTEFIRLDSFLKFIGALSTGGEAKFAIKNKKVKVNGEICTMRGKKMYDGDIAEYNNVIYEVCYS